MGAYRCVCVCVCVSTSLCMHVWLRSYSSFSPLGLLMFPFIDQTLHWLFHHYPTCHFLCCQTFITRNPRPSKRTSDEGRTEQGGEPGEEQKTMTEPHCRTQSQQLRTHTHTCTVQIEVHTDSRESVNGVLNKSNGTAEKDQNMSLTLWNVCGSAL